MDPRVKHWPGAAGSCAPENVFQSRLGAFSISQLDALVGNELAGLYGACQHHENNQNHRK